MAVARPCEVISHASTCSVSGVFPGPSSFQGARHPHHAADLGLGVIEDGGPAGLIEAAKIRHLIISYGDERLLAPHVHPYLPRHIREYADS